jgi:NADH:ubiquinone oxidoreductase subunit E
MPIEVMDTKKVVEAVHDAVDRHGATKDELIPILNDVNRAVGYLPGEALDEISRLLRVPKSNLFSVASFYRMLSTKPRGKHVIQFCESAPCHVAGGRGVWETVKETLTINEDETTLDGKWTLITTSCLGVCGVGPVMMIDDDVYGNVDPKQVPSILAKYH